MADRCSGHCCRGFGIGGITIQDLEDDLARTDGHRWDPEQSRKLVAMLVPLPSENGQSLFTCRKLHTITGDCTDYENRPKLCRDYPYDHACTFKGCTSDEARSRGVEVLKSKRLQVIA